jgi:imidazoleglycerol-phosphate dehydratase/histidinol-phosphatase
MKPKILFVDRDGTLIQEPQDFKVDSLEKVKPMLGVLEVLPQIIKRYAFRLVMVSNQDGLGTPVFPLERFESAHQYMLEIFARHQIRFDEILIDGSFEHENKPTRKPGIGLTKHYLSGEYDIEGSFMIGDRYTDVQFAQNMGCQSILLLNPRLAPAQGSAHYAARNWYEILELLDSLNRSA